LGAQNDGENGWRNTTLNLQESGYKNIGFNTQSNDYCWENWNFELESNL